MEEQLEYDISLECLKLENFRCFGEIEIKFEDRLTVFIADNGGGKTTILDALAEGLRAYLSTLKVKGYEKSSLLPRDVKIGTSKGGIVINTDIGYILSLKDWDNFGTQVIEREVDSRSEKEVVFSISVSDDGCEFVKNNTAFEQYYAKYFKTYFRDADLPVLVYYGDSGTFDYNIKDKAKNRLEYVYKNALDHSRINYTAFYDWFETRYRMYLQKKVEDSEENKDKTMQEIDPELFKIRKIIELILNDNIDDEKYKDLKMEYGKGGAQIVLGKQNENKKYDYFELNQFSAGERSLIALVADLGIRLLNATPMRKTTQGVKDVVSDDSIGKITGKGIVLIDEVDLHLHPNWQRKVVGKLMEIFPDVQFIMSTHSAEVLKGLERKNLRRMKGYKVIEISPYIKGRDANSILSDAFDLSVHTPDDEKRIAAFYKLVETDKIAARKILDELKTDWGEMDEEILRAESYFEIF